MPSSAGCMTINDWSSAFRQQPATQRSTERRRHDGRAAAAALFHCCRALCWGWTLWLRPTCPASLPRTGRAGAATKRWHLAMRCWRGCERRLPHSRECTCGSAMMERAAAARQEPSTVALWRAARCQAEYRAACGSAGWHLERSVALSNTARIVGLLSVTWLSCHVAKQRS